MAHLLFGGGPPGLLPSSFASLKYWFDTAQSSIYSDAGVTLATNGQTVQQWSNMAQAKHLSQATAGFRPTYVTAVQNNLPIVRFDAADDTLTRTANNDDDDIDNANMTAFTVAKTNNTVNGISWFWDMNDGAQQVLAQLKIATGSSQSRNYDGSADVANKAYTESQFNIHTFLHTGGNVSNGVNDARTASLTNTASGNSSFGANTNLLMRQVASAEVVDIGELIIFKAALTESERQDIERRLAWKWSIPIAY